MCRWCQGSRGAAAAPAAGRAGDGAASASAAFHVELTETCVDLLARYTSSPCSVKPARCRATTGPRRHATLLQINFILSYV